MLRGSRASDPGFSFLGGAIATIFSACSFAAFMMSRGDGRGEPDGVPSLGVDCLLDEFAPRRRRFARLRRRRFASLRALVVFFSRARIFSSAMALSLLRDLVLDALRSKLRLASTAFLQLHLRALALLRLGFLLDAFFLHLSRRPRRTESFDVPVGVLGGFADALAALAASSARFFSRSARRASTALAASRASSAFFLRSSASSFARRRMSSRAFSATYSPATVAAPAAA